MTTTTTTICECGEGFSAKKEKNNENLCRHADTNATERSENVGLPKMNVKRHEESINLKVIPVLCVS